MGLKNLRWLALIGIAASSIALGQITTALPLIGQRGTSNPSACTLGQLLFRTDATAGSNIYGCTATNTWTQQGGGAAAGVTVGTSVITSGTDTYVLYNNNGVLGNASTLRINSAAGQGPSIVAGTAITDVNALNITQTWNQGSTNFTGLKLTVTSTAMNSASALFDFSTSSGGQFLGVASGSLTSLKILAPASLTARILLNGDNATNNHQITSATGAALTLDSFTNGIAFSISGTSRLSLAATTGNILTGTKVLIGAAAPTVASGGCLTGAGTVITNSNGTAGWTTTLGTGCSGSQPIVFTLPTASTGWLCWARNVSNAATSSPAQTGAVSTTSVTITNYVRTTGVAGAWTDSDVVVVGCHGY